MVHHGDPAPHGVGGDRVGDKVLGQHVVVNKCHGVHHFSDSYFGIQSAPKLVGWRRLDGED